MRKFIDLPYRLHSTSTVWVPPLRIERYLFLNRRLNAFFKHGEAQLFLARRDGRVVGRISAQIDTAFNEFHANAWGMFGFLELEDDPEAAAALLDAAAAWLAGMAAWPVGSARRSTPPSTTSTGTRGGCSASSSSRTTPRSCPRC